jgi:hypothetical protein
MRYYFRRFLPAFINKAVKDENSSDYVTRREIHVWKSFVDDSKLPLVFSDYGIRNPKAEDDIIAPNANGKIRYTIENKHFVVRGYSKLKGDGYKQLHKLAENIVNSPNFLGPDFSWGDEDVLRHVVKKNSVVILSGSAMTQTTI